MLTAIALKDAFPMQLYFSYILNYLPKLLICVCYCVPPLNIKVIQTRRKTVKLLGIINGNKKKIRGFNLYKYFPLLRVMTGSLRIKIRNIGIKFCGRNRTEIHLQQKKSPPHPPPPPPIFSGLAFSKKGCKA